MRDVKTRSGVTPDYSRFIEKGTPNPLTISQLTEYYEKKQRRNEKGFDNNSIRGYYCRPLKRPHLLKLPKIVRQQASVLPAAPRKKSYTSKDNESNLNGIKLPILPGMRKKSTIPNENHTKDSQSRMTIETNFDNAAKTAFCLRRETSRIDSGNLNKEEIKEKEPTEKELERSKEMGSDSSPKPTTTDGKSGPKTISCSEYAKKMMMRKKKSWKDRRKEAKLFDINLINPQRAMLTSSATARGLKVLKTNEITIYRFCLSNYSDVDINTVTKNHEKQST